MRVFVCISVPILLDIVSRSIASCPCNHCGPTTLCHQMRLMEVPYTIPTSDVTRLLLYSNQITKLSANEFQGMFRVIELDLHSNKIYKIDRDAFADLENLENLHLSDNNIDYIPQKTLLSVPKLTRLFLDKNKLKRLPADIPSLTGLTKLNIGLNQITSIPWSSFYGLKRLENLIMWSNPLTCDCNNLELIKWCKTTPQCISIYTDIKRGNCTTEVMKESCKVTKNIEVTHLHDNGTWTLEKENASYAVYVQSDFARLHCNLTGDPMPLIVWKTPSAGHVYPHTFGRITAFSNGTLMIQNLRVSDTGKYSCHPRLVDAINLTSPILDLKVVKGLKPKIVYSTENVKGIARTVVQLQCQSVGNPPPVIKWHPPKSSHALGKANFTMENAKYTTNADGSELLISNFSIEDAGMWKCRVSNSMGFDEAYIQVNYDEAKDNLLLILIITGCIVVGIIIIVVVVVTCVIARRRRQKQPRNRSQGYQQTSEGSPTNVIEIGGTTPSYETDNPQNPRGDVLQQPYTQDPEVKGFRI